MNKLISGVDFFFNKMIPKKLLVWVIATVLCFLGVLNGDLWAYISMMYIGTNVLQKFSVPINKRLYDKEEESNEEN